MSKIPEGATHTYAELYGSTYWKKVGDDWFGYADGDWILVNSPSFINYEPIKSRTEWLGDGLPPVGAVCDLKFKHWDDWEPHEILCHGKTFMFVRELNSGLDREGSMSMDGIMFRPIRTPEQVRAESIAAEERKKDIDKIQEIYEMTMSTSRRGHASRPAIEALYDAGLRFVEVTK